MKLRTMFLATLLASVIWLTACTVPSWVNTVESDAEIAAPIAASIIDVVDPGLAPLVSLIENGFSALAKTLDTYKASPIATNLQAVQSAFAAVNTNVASLENAAQIKNTAKDATVTGVVQLLSQAVTEITALVPPATSSAMGIELPATHGVVKGWKANDFKKQFNGLIKGDSRFKPLK
jgi:hypothetical protein